MNKVLSLIKGIVTILVFVTPRLFSQNINNAFEIKQHKDTLLNKADLNATVINGVNNIRVIGSRPFTKTNNSMVNPFAKNTLGQTFKKCNELKIVRSTESNLPIFISATPDNLTAKTSFSNDKKSSCYFFLNEISYITQISSPEKDFEIRKIENEINGKSHIRLNQKYKGIEIYGSEVMVHLDAAGSGELFNGKYHLIKNDIDTIPAIERSKAIEIVISDISTKTKYTELNSTEKELLEYSIPSIVMVIYEDKVLTRTYLLAYKILIRPNSLEQWEYVVDAKNGKILESYNMSCHVDGPRSAISQDLNGFSRTINTYQEGSDYLLLDASKSMYNATTQEGAIITLDAKFTFGSNFKVEPLKTSNNVWNNPTGISAHYNAGVAFDYYKTVHNRNSIDGNGGNIFSIINVVDDDGTALDNAYWNGKCMFYGNGNTAFKPLAGGLDVAGHEITHGVVQNSAALKYQGESGAINESMADIFGCMMDSTDWLIGEDVVKLSAYPSGALRSLSDPHNGGNSLSDDGFQPRHANEQYQGTEDNGGVHINSGIPNWAFYKLAMSIGKSKSSKIFYRTLTTYLTQSSQFIDLRLGAIQSAKDLYGNSSNEAIQVGLAFDAVGISDGTAGVYTTTLPTNPGIEYLLSYDTDINNTNGLYRSSPIGTSFTALLDKSVGNKPSVTDDGSTAVFVGTNKKIYGISVDPAVSIQLTTLQNQAIWSNVAISKDGKRLAAITYDKDTSIYVYDFTIASWSRFMLYNPTNTQGVKAGGPVYADGLEWDYSGEYLVYDCFNSITNTGGDDVEYWDINLIKVYDNEKNDYSNGDIFKLFNNLGEGESIGNPTFSKNSPYIMAFDYINSNTGDFGIIGYDIEKNDVNSIASNNAIGWPSFNKNDNRIAFTSDDGNGNSIINYVDLNSDKISSNGIKTQLIDIAKWPVYYTVGARSFSSSQPEITNSEIMLFPNPVKDELSIIFPEMTGPISFQILNQLGQSFSMQSYDNNTQDSFVKLKVSELPSGIYFCKIQSSTYTVTHKFIKQD